MAEKYTPEGRALATQAINDKEQIPAGLDASTLIQLLNGQADKEKMLTPILRKLSGVGNLHSLLMQQTKNENDIKHAGE